MKKGLPTVCLQRRNQNGFNTIAAILAVILLAAGGIVGYVLSQNKGSAPPTTSSYKLPQTSSQEEGAVTVWAWNIAAKSLNALVPAFNKIYPNIKIQVLEIPYDEANNKFRLAMNSGSGFPDVWTSEGPVTGEYIQRGALLDITDKALPYKNDFVNYKWAEVTRGSRIYALPWDTAPVGLFYRRDLFQDAGVNPETINTWDDFIAAGKKITKDRNGDGKPDQFITLMSRKSDIHETFMTLLNEFGGTLFDQNGKPAFNSPAGLQAVNLMKKILDAGIVADIGWWSPEFFQGIKTGQIASLAQGVWMGGQIKETAPGLAGKWGVIPLPAARSGGIRTAVRGGSNLAIPAKAKNSDAAWKFVEFAMTHKDSQLAMYKQYNLFPALKAAYSDPVFGQPDSYFANQNISQLFIELQDQLPTNFFYGPNQTGTVQILNKEIILALNGSKTPERALRDAEVAALQLTTVK